MSEPPQMAGDSSAAIIPSVVVAPRDWLPAVYTLADAGGDWKSYIEVVYGTFRKDFVMSQPKFEGKAVVCRRDPIYDGKEAGFWHCTSTGDNEEEREPDLRRCERMAWPRAIIENCGDSRVQSWSTNRRGGWRSYLWFNEDYLIAMGARWNYWQLITAFCTPQEHARRKLRREWNECKKQV